MILSHRHRYVFIHIPKTGGTAVTHALERHLGEDDLVLGDTPEGKLREGRVAGQRLWKHSRWSELGSLRDGAQGYRVFTIVRNPWDGFVSFYAWAQKQRFDHPMIEAAQKLTFSAFLRHPYVVGAVRSLPYKSYVEGAVSPQYLRFENLAADFSDLCRQLGVGEVELPRVNTSDRERDYRAYYKDQDIAQVATISAADISAFGYRF